MMEWCWLLEWYGRLRDRHVKQYVDALYNSAIQNGLNTDTGFLINEYNRRAILFTQNLTIFEFISTKSDSIS